MHGFFPTGANRMARRIILNHPSISGKNRARTVVRFSNNAEAALREWCAENGIDLRET
jgi:hypothetical protein